jgi:putative membrane protein
MTGSCPGAVIYRRSLEVTGVMYGPWDGGWAVGMMFMSFLFVAIIVVGVVLLVRSTSRDGQPLRAPGSDRALEILDERFARGEIDQAEYEERRRILTQGR